MVKAYRLARQWDEADRYNSFREKYEIHPSFRFNGESILIYGDGKLFIDENSYIGWYSTIQLASEHSVRIGKNCRIGHNVRIYTSSLIPDQDFGNYSDLKRRSGNVVIQDNVWIGANVFINPGVTIGENSIVGANSVVTKDIPRFSIYGGVPSKLIRNKSITIDAK